MSDGESKESEEDKKKDDLNEQNNTADSDEKKDKDKDKEEIKKAEPTQHAKGAGGEHPKKKLKSITNDSFEQKKD